MKEENWQNRTKLRAEKDFPSPTQQETLKLKRHIRTILLSQRRGAMCGFA